MKKYITTSYQKIEKLISFLQDNEKQKPSIDEITTKLSMSKPDIEQLVYEWSGTTLKQLVQYINSNYTKEKLSKKQHTLFEEEYKKHNATNEHIQIERLTKEELESNQLMIRFQFYTTPFGNIFIASTPKGICSMEFYEDESTVVDKISALFPHAIFSKEKTTIHELALENITNPIENKHAIILHIKASEFQYTIWQALLKIPFGELSTYGKLAVQLNIPGASRAIGTAIGSNPIAYIIPCHRVVQSTGHTGGYMWQPNRKIAIIAWEAAQLYTTK